MYSTKYHEHQKIIKDDLMIDGSLFMM